MSTLRTVTLIFLGVVFLMGLVFVVWTKDPKEGEDGAKIFNSIYGYTTVVISFGLLLAALLWEEKAAKAPPKALPKAAPQSFTITTGTAGST